MCKRLFFLATAGVLPFLLSGCLFTKVVSVPMRVAGALVSVVPVAGDAGHEAIDAAANAVDDLPF